MFAFWLFNQEIYSQIDILYSNRKFMCIFVCIHTFSYLIISVLLSMALDIARTSEHFPLYTFSFCDRSDKCIKQYIMHTLMQWMKTLVFILFYFSYKWRWNKVTVRSSKYLLSGKWLKIERWLLCCRTNGNKKIKEKINSNFRPLSVG